MAAPFNTHTALILYRPLIFPSSPVEGNPGDHRSLSGFEYPTSRSEESELVTDQPNIVLNKNVFRILTGPPPSLQNRSTSSPIVSDDGGGLPHDAKFYGPPRKKIAVKRKTPPSDDVFRSESGNRQSLSGEEDEARKKQWKVGKTPGHQGSHLKTPRKTPSSEVISSPSSGEKRSLKQSITNSAERVLKKPFRPPVPRFVLPKAKPKEPSPSVHRSLSPTSRSHSQSSPPSKHSTTSCTKPSEYTNMSTPQDSDPSFPVFKSTPKPIRPPSMARIGPGLSKPFTSPAKSDRSGAPSPSSRGSRSSRPSRGGGLTLSKAKTDTQTTSAPSDRSQILVLETKIRKLKEAISCINDDKEAELEELIHKWRAGGREIVERFFVVVPRQEESSEANNPQSSFNYPWSEDAPRGPMLTEEQREYLARAPTNDDGDPVDHEGNPLLPEMMTREEVMRGINAETEAGERREGQGEYRPTSMTRARQTPTSDSIDTGEPGVTTASASVRWSWNHGTMMERFLVEPSLLGWNAEEEEWVDE